MKPRLGAVDTAACLFDLEMAKYDEDLSNMRKYLDPGFMTNYEYPIGSFLFKPVNKVSLFTIIKQNTT